MVADPKKEISTSQLHKVGSVLGNLIYFMEKRKKNILVPAKVLNTLNSLFQEVTANICGEILRTFY